MQYSHVAKVLLLWALAFNSLRVKWGEAFASAPYQASRLSCSCRLLVLSGPQLCTQEQCSNFSKGVSFQNEGTWKAYSSLYPHIFTLKSYSLCASPNRSKHSSLIALSWSTPHYHAPPLLSGFRAWPFPTEPWIPSWKAHPRPLHS